MNILKGIFWAGMALSACEYYVWLKKWNAMSAEEQRKWVESTTESVLKIYQKMGILPTPQTEEPSADEA